MTTEPPMSTDRCPVLDAGAVIKIARGDRAVRRRLEKARVRGVEMFVPAAVVAETVRGSGPRDAPVNLVISSTDGVSLLDEATARRAGRLLGESRSNSTVDALVVAEALARRPCSILTGDPTNLSVLLGAHRGVRIVPI